MKSDRRKAAIFSALVINVPESLPINKIDEAPLNAVKAFNPLAARV